MLNLCFIFTNPTNLKRIGGRKWMEGSSVVGYQYPKCSDQLNTIKLHTYILTTNEQLRIKGSAAPLLFLVIKMLRKLFRKRKKVREKQKAFFCLLRKITLWQRFFCPFLAPCCLQQDDPNRVITELEEAVSSGWSVSHWHIYYRRWKRSRLHFVILSAEI